MEPPPPMGALTWSWRVPFAPRSVREAREQLTAALGAADVAPTTVEDARIVLSELVGNAVRHARPLTDGHLAVQVSVDEDAVRLSVVDGGSGTLPALQHSSELAPGGRGLSIVRTLTSDWGVREATTGNIVFGVLPRH